MSCPFPLRIAFAVALLMLSACNRAPVPIAAPAAHVPTAEPTLAQIVFELLPGATPLEVTTTATVLADVNTLPAPVAGARVVAAGRFEPSGMKFPNGINVTWPLPERREPGSPLYILNLIETENRWEDTGETAVVSPSGMQATGKAFHFSVLGLSDQKPGDPSPSPKKDEPSAERPPGAFYSLVPQASDIKVVEHPKLEAALKAYEAACKNLKDGRMTKDGMKAVYQAGDFETVKTLIEQNKIRNDKTASHSIDMADLRILMMVETFESISREKKWKIYRSDSGNQSAGMSSDVDQTIFVYEYKDGRLVRNENLDVDFINLFRERFQKMHGLSVESLDIATIAGKDKYPDWRLTAVQLDHEGKRPVRQHAAETMTALRKTPGAYTFCGAVIQQMQLRVADLVEQNLREGKSSPVPKDGREMHPELRAKMGEEGRLSWLACMEIGPGDTEDGAVRPREVFQETAIDVLFDSQKPKLLKGHSYDAAVANYLEFMKHLSHGVPGVKYHLRALDDGAHTLWRLIKGGPKVEYHKLKTDTERRAHLADVLGNDLAKKRWDGTSFLDRWKAAFDISAKIRQLHNDKKLTEQSMGEAFEELAKEIAGKDHEAEWRKFIPEARAEYERRCQEFFVHNIIATSQQRVIEWLSDDANNPDKRAQFELALDEHQMRAALGFDGPENDTDWKAIREELMKNFSELARLQLLYSFRDMRLRPDLVKEIIERAKRNGIAPADLARLEGLVRESNSRFFTVKEIARVPKIYWLVYKAQGKKAIAHYANKAKEWTLTELGVVDTDINYKPSEFVKKHGLGGTEAKFNEILTKHKMLGTGARFVRNWFYNVGTPVAASTLLREFSESGGDPEVLQAGILRELLNTMPVVGVAKGIWDAQGVGQTFLAIAPIFVPEAGIVIAVFTVAENGIVLYEHEWSRPLTDETADAIYRGYVGPTLFDFSKEGIPPQYSDKDKESLEQSQEEIKQLTGKTGKAEQAQLGKSKINEQLLLFKRSAWKTWEREDNRYRGSALLGTGKQMTQKPLDIGRPTDELFKDEPIGTPGSLLARVKPIILYSRGRDGPVDFTVKALTEAEQKRRGELDKKLNEILDPDVWLEIQAEWVKLERQHQMYERAQRYLVAAEKNRELMHQIRRDSLWPYMLQDRTNEMVASRNFAAKWVSIRRDILEAGLKNLDVKDPRPHAAAVLDELGDRLLEDTGRSKHLWLIYQETLKAQAKDDQEEMLHARGAMIGEVLADAVREPASRLSAGAQALLAKRGLKPADYMQLSAVASAYLWKHVPEMPPRLKVGVRKVPGEKEGQFEYCADVRVTANPKIYVPPYHVKMVQLDPASVQTAASSKSYKGLPLDEATVKKLTEHLKRNPVPKDDNAPFIPAVLVFVFCEDLKIPERVVPETVADLPKLPRVTIPDEGKTAYYFGGTMAGSAAITGELQIIVKRPKTAVGGPATDTWIEIKSVALEKLEPKGLQGLEMRLYRSQSPEGPFDQIETSKFFVFPHIFNRPDGIYRIAKDKYVLPEGVGQGLLYQGKVPYKPFYYRVGQVPAKMRGDGKVDVLGEEVLSNVSGPSKAMLELVGANWAKGPPIVDGKLVVTEPNRFFPRFWVAMSLEDQFFDLRGTELKVDAGSWKGTFWTSRKEGEKEIGGGARGSSVDLPQTIFPDGAQVTILGKNGPFQAKLEFRIPANPLMIGGIRSNAEREVKQFEGEVASYEKNLKSSEKLVKESEADLAKAKQGTKNHYYARSSLEAYRFSIALTRDYQLPLAKVNLRRAQSALKFDLPAVVQTYKEEISLRAKERELKLATAKANPELWQYALTIATFADGDRKNYEKQIKDHPEELKRLEKQLNEGLAYFLTPGIDAAYNAADLVSVEALSQEQIRVWKELSIPSYTIGRLRALANEVATLSGNRDKAADLFMQAQTLELQSADAKQREQILKSRKYQILPGWWPEGRPVPDDMIPPSTGKAGKGK